MPIFPGYCLANCGFSIDEVDKIKKHNAGKPNKKKKQFKSYVAIYVKEDIPFTKADYVLKREDKGASCSVEIHIKKKIYHFCSVYYPNGTNKTDTEQFKKFVSNTDHKEYIFSGDFNDHAELWSNLDKDKNKITKLSTSINEANLIKLNDGSATRFPPRADQTPSAIDLTFVSPNLGDSHWSVITDRLGFSDHCPIFGSISLSGIFEPSIPKPAYVYDKANWVSYRSLLSSNESNSPGENSNWENLDVNSYFDKFHENIFKVADDATVIPKTKFHPNYNNAPWWTEECSLAKHNVQIASHNYTVNLTTDNKEILDDMVENYNQTLAQAKLKDWENTLDRDIVDYRDSSVLWRKIKKIKRRRPGGKSPIIWKGESCTTDKEKAKALAESISGNSKTECLKDKDEIRRRANFEQNEFKDPIPDNTLKINAPITMSELEEAIKDIKSKKKACGSDPLNYLMISHLPQNQKHTLLGLFNKCLTQGQIPDKWKEAQVFTLLKPGKPPSDPNSYRPISLTPHTGKLFEKIMKSRLEHYLEENIILPDAQSGFRHSRSTTDNLTYLTERMKAALRQKYQGMYCTFFDIEKAFDRVWHAKLLSKLAGIGISGNMYQVIKSFLTGRKIAVKYGNEISSYHDIDMGVPQGAVLSPLLFIIMLHDIEEEVELKGNKIMLYADDIALLSEIGPMKKGGVCTGDPVNKELLAKHQKAIDSLIKYMEDHGFTFSGKKTQFQCVSNYNTPKREAEIEVNGDRIKHSNLIKYLGLTFHSQLSWKAHFTEVKKKSYKINNLLKILSAQSWAMGTKFLVDVARSLIRSLVSYGQECFFAAKQNELKILDTIEHIALRIVLGVPPNTPHEHLHSEVGWLPLEEERRIRCAEYVIRTQKIDGNLVTPFLSNVLGKHSKEELKSLKTKAMRSMVGRTKSLWELTEPTLNGANLKLSSIEKIVVPYLLTHEQIPVVDVNSTNSNSAKEKVLVHYTLTGKKSDNLDLAGIEANEYIDKHFQDYFQVYTDGSVHANKSTGIGIVWRKPSKSFHPLPYRNNSRKGKCTMSVELEAILGALETIQEYKYKKNVILTDSLSAIQALQTKPRNNFELQDLIKLRLKEIYNENYSVEICHVPSHCKVLGNDKADRQANFGAQLNRRIPFDTLSRKEGYRLVREAAQADKTNFKTFSSEKFNKKGTFPKGENRHSIVIYRRLKLQNPRFKWWDLCSGSRTTCPHCDEAFSLGHITETPCPSLLIEFELVTNVLKAAGITILDALRDGKLNEAFTFIDCLRSSSVGHLF